MVTGSANYYFDKDVDYDGSETDNINMIDKNFTNMHWGLNWVFPRNFG